MSTILRLMIALPLVFIIKLGIYLFTLPTRILYFCLGIPYESGIITLPEDHPQMAQAIVEARASLDEFRKKLNHPTPEMEEFALKVKLAIPDGGFEHCWVNQIRETATGFKGKLANEPMNLPDLSLESPVEISDEMITDWTYCENGYFHGHYTTRVILPNLSKRMRRHVERFYGWDQKK